MKMNKPNIEKGSFYVDDIHKIREYNYEKTKNLSSKDLIKYINDRAEKTREEIRKRKKDIIAI